MSNDWLPSNRTLVLTMCRNWIAYMTGDVRAAWGGGGAAAGQFTELGGLFGNADALLRKAVDEAERTHVITVECHAAFTALKEKMRFFRDRYFKMPPLTERDWAALGFRPRDTHPTPVPQPDGVPAVSLSYPGGPHALTAHLGPLAGTRELDPNSDYGYAIYVGIMPAGGVALEQAGSTEILHPLRL
jgi:hypothetical protein